MTFALSLTYLLPGLRDEMRVGEANAHGSCPCWHGPAVHSHPAPFACISTLCFAPSPGFFSSTVQRRVGSRQSWRVSLGAEQVGGPGGMGTNCSNPIPGQVL